MDKFVSYAAHGVKALADHAIEYDFDGIVRNDSDAIGKIMKRHPELRSCGSVDIWTAPVGACGRELA